MTLYCKWFKVVSDTFREKQEDSLSCTIIRARERLGSVTTLLAWLEEHQKQVASQLHQLIQVNYHSFLEVCFIVVVIDWQATREESSFLFLHWRTETPGRWLEATSPGLLLPRVSYNIQNVSRFLLQEETEIQARLDHAQELSEKKKILELFIHIHKIITKLKKLLERKFTALETLHVQAAHFERISNEFNQLRYYVEEGTQSLTSYWPFRIQTSFRGFTIRRDFYHRGISIIQPLCSYKRRF